MLRDSSDTEDDSDDDTISSSDVDDVSDDDGATFSSDVDEDVFDTTKSTHRAAADQDDDDDDDDVDEESPKVEEPVGGKDGDGVEFDHQILAGIRKPIHQTSRRRQREIIYPNINDSMADEKCATFVVAETPIDLPEKCIHFDEPSYEEVVMPPPESVLAAEEQDLVPITELDEVSRLAFAGRETLNLIQTIAFDAAYNTDENLLICAPTGAGKTNIAMLAVLHEVRKHICDGVVKTDEFKIIYVAPLKALAAEMVETFGSRLKPLGITVRELTGDTQLSVTETREAQMLVVTPEKWDGITRKSTGDAALIHLVNLFIIDEVHLLHEDRGAVIECLVARTLRQVEAYHNSIRIVGLSATLPNYKDVAKFLHVDLDKGLFFFDARFRPVPLRQSLIGVKESAILPREMERLQKDNICYERVKKLLKGDHQVLIFVFSRNGTRDTAKEMLTRLGSRSKTLFSTQSHASYHKAMKELEECDDVLKDLVPEGFAVHHAGISRPGRNFVEKYFAAGLIRVLCCTTTLAWGVNLPAHAVIIKGTQYFNAEKSRYEDVGILDVLQIFGRAGRPQYDTFGEGYIITSHSKLPHYLKLLMTQTPIESQFEERLTDNLNAEIVLGTVSNTEEALRWLKYTYLYTRMRLNPEGYDLLSSDVVDDRRLDVVLEGMVASSATDLLKSRMARAGEVKGSLEYTEIGRIASHFYVSWRTIRLFNDRIPKFRDEEDIFDMISKAHVFKYVKVRKEEQKESGTLKERYCEINVPNSPLPISKGPAKVNILLQTYISQVKPKNSSLVSSLNNIAQNAVRLMRALFELAVNAGRPHMADEVLKYTKAADQKIWPKENPLTQLESWECTLVVASAPSEQSLGAEELREMSDLAIGSWFALTFSCQRCSIIICH
ncbi:activating signal cointegrator 1 complex subunit 3-like [Diadema antillarum]|uniref:activating signal cointegrator 1 complex subunit 3-like n=1 Tax=Diadema antillarum TaxID=105358 RepID=UPI003A8B4A98